MNASIGVLAVVLLLAIGCGGEQDKTGGPTGGVKAIQAQPDARPEHLEEADSPLGGASFWVPRGWTEDEPFELSTFWSVILLAPDDAMGKAKLLSCVEAVAFDGSIDFIFDQQMLAEKLHKNEPEVLSRSHITHQGLVGLRTDVRTKEKGVVNRRVNVSLSSSLKITKGQWLYSITLSGDDARVEKLISLLDECASGLQVKKK